MENSIRIAAPAKLNLHLDISDKRPDGFHELRSLFVMISMYDTLTVKELKENGCVIKGCEHIPTQKNLIWMAYQKYCHSAGSMPGLEVECNKEIPEMAGLGGGSSDAAAMLRVLRLLHPVDLGDDEILRIASELGSDVPFFLYSPSALVEGRGEHISPIRTPVAWDCVVIKPDFNISTAEAYQELDVSNRSKDGLLSAEEIQTQYHKKPNEWGFFNSFTPVLINRYPQLKEYKKFFEDNGADYSELSGSGSAFFGVFRDSEIADKCYFSAKKGIKKVWKVKMLASLTEAVYN